MRRQVHRTNAERLRLQMHKQLDECISGEPAPRNNITTQSLLIPIIQTATLLASVATQTQLSEIEFLSTPEPKKRIPGPEIKDSLITHG